MTSVPRAMGTNSKFHDSEVALSFASLCEVSCTVCDISSACFYAKVTDDHKVPVTLLQTPSEYEYAS
eukprot:4179652-Amphidinium_carterae.2